MLASLLVFVAVSSVAVSSVYNLIDGLMGLSVTESSKLAIDEINHVREAQLLPAFQMQNERYPIQQVRAKPTDEQLAEIVEIIAPFRPEMPHLTDAENEILKNQARAKAGGRHFSDLYAKEHHVQDFLPELNESITASKIYQVTVYLKLLITQRSTNTKKNLLRQLRKIRAIRILSELETTPPLADDSTPALSDSLRSPDPPAVLQAAAARSSNVTDNQKGEAEDFDVNVKGNLNVNVNEHNDDEKSGDDAVAADASLRLCDLLILFLLHPFAIYSLPS